MRFALKRTFRLQADWQRVADSGGPIRRGCVVFLAVLLVQCAPLVWGQALPFRDFGSDEGFQNWSSVNAVLQDQDGYLWFGTMDGVYRYDSQRFEFFTLGEDLADPTVLSLAQDGQGRVWAGTVSGRLFYFTGEAFEEFPLPDAMRGVRIWTLETDWAGRLWIGSERGVLVVDDRGVTDFSDHEDCPDWVLDIEVDGKQRIWFALSWGLYRFENGAFDEVVFNVGLPRTVIRDIFEDSAGELYFGTDVGAFRLAGDRVTRELRWGTEFDGATHTIAEDATGALWLGTSDGAHRMTEDGIQTYSTATGLAGDTVNEVIADAEGNLWIATQGGLSSLSALDFEWYSVYQGLPGNHVSAVDVGADDTLWGGTFGNGAFHLRDDTITALPYPDRFPLKRLLSVLEDSEGRVWYGAMEGLAVGGADGFSLVHLADEGTLGGSHFLYEDSSGRVWVAYQGGAAYFEDGQFHAAPESWGLSAVRVRCIIESRDNALYFGTIESGIVRITDGTPTRFLEEDGLASNSIFDVTEDEDGALWFATWNGLSRYRDGVFKTFSVNGESNPGRCFSVAVSGGRVYAGTTRGLAILNPDTGDIEVLTSNDGMMATEATRASLAVTDAGKLWIGSRKGLMRFSPEHHRKREAPPPVSITMVRAGDEDILDRVNPRLGYRQNSLQFSFQGRHFANPDRLNYRHRLLGADAQWLETAETTVLYPFLPPGSYAFQVVAVTDYGVESTEPAQYAVRIAPPFWSTWWFRGAMITLVAASLYAIYWTRTRNMRIRNEMLERRIEERRQAQEEQSRLAAAIEQAAEAVVITDATGIIQYVNPACVALRGFEAGECIGKDPRDLWLSDLDTETREAIETPLSCGEVWTGRAVNTTKDGQRIMVEGTVSPVHGEDGSIINYVSVVRDITRELALEAQLSHARRMEAVGQLAGGVAHDFNNLLHAIMGYMDLAMEEPQVAGQAKAHLAEARSASERAAALVRQLLLFSRRETPRAQTIRLSEVIQNLGNMLRRVIGTHIELKIEHVPGPATIHADPGQIEQIVMNLCVNARDVMPDGGALGITVSNVTFDKSFTVSHPWARPGHFVELAVRDSGPGIPPEIRDRIFEPFFTTKERGKGTGMGLSTVYGIVSQHDGFMNVESSPGEGSTFYLYFPAHEATGEDGESSSGDVAEPLPRGSGTVLLAEDEAMVRNLAVRLLEKAGYSVIAAEDGEQAYRIFNEAPQAPDMFMLDIIMPKMNGPALAALILDRRPDARILFCSGYGREMLDEHKLPNCEYRLVQKPYKSKELLAALAEMMAVPKEG